MKVEGSKRVSKMLEHLINEIRFLKTAVYTLLSTNQIMAKGRNKQKKGVKKPKKATIKKNNS